MAGFFAKRLTADSFQQPACVGSTAHIQGDTKKWQLQQHQSQQRR
jgi:hypothetical protein